MDGAPRRKHRHCDRADSRASWCLTSIRETAALETLQRLEKELGPLPPTVTSNTGGGGEHRIFEYPDFPVRKDSAGKLLGPGVDVLSDGCIMVAPPSRHASGNRYRWEEGKSFRDLDQPPCRNRGWIDCVGIPQRSPMPTVHRHNPRNLFLKVSVTRTSPALPELFNAVGPRPNLSRPR